MFLNNFMLKSQPIASVGPLNYADRREVAIGDLGGDYNRFQDLVVRSGLVEVDGSGCLTWIGGNGKLSFAGDILADRAEGGIKIMCALLDLEQQATRFGGEIGWRLGNHDYEFLRLLSGETDVAGVRRMVSIGEYKGLKEALDFLNLSRYERAICPLNVDLNEIVPAMRVDERGKKLIEAITRFDLYDFDPQTGVLYLHTDPVKNVLDLLVEDLSAQNSILSFVRFYIKHLLSETIAPEWADYFKDRFESFVDCKNRFIWKYRAGGGRYVASGTNAERNQNGFIQDCESQLSVLYQKGVRTMCFGHTTHPFFCFGVRGDHMYFSLDSNNAERFSDSEPPSGGEYIHFVALDRAGGKSNPSIEIIREGVQNHI